MRAFDVRWVRLAVAAGAIVGSALVSSVAVATDEAPPIDPAPTETTDIGPADVGQSSTELIVVDPPPPFEDIAVIEIVLPDPEMPDPEMLDPEFVEPEMIEPEMLGPDATEPAVVEMVLGSAADSTTLPDESSGALPSESMPTVSLMMEEPGADAHETEEPGTDHEGGSGGQGNPNRLTFIGGVVRLGRDADRRLRPRAPGWVRALGNQPDRQRNADVGDVHLSRRQRRADLRVQESGPRFGHRGPHRPRTPHRDLHGHRGLGNGRLGRRGGRRYISRSRRLPTRR